MTHRLRTGTRTLATAVSLTAAMAAADVVHTAEGSAWSFAVAALLALAAVLVIRFHEVALHVDDDVVTVRNLVSVHELPRAAVAAVVPGTWRSTVVLTDGSTLPVLLRTEDLPTDLDVHDEPHVIDLTELAAAV